MSAYSTINITREKAVEILIRRVTEADRNTLEDMMDSLLAPRLYNCVIVDDPEKSEDCLL